MSSFYKMDPAAWDFGTAELSLEQEAAYLRIVNAIHKHDQPVPDNDRVLAGMFRCSTRKARALLEQLIEAGKLRIEGNRITNDRAASDLVHRGFVSGSRAESGAKGGRTRASNAAKALENKDPGQAIASSRIEENREDIPVANATGRDDASKPDPKKEFWDEARAYLTGNGVPKSNAGTLIGKLVKDHGFDRTRDAVRAAITSKPAEPIPWITAALTKPANQPAITSNVLSLVAAQMEADEAYEKQRAAR